ncbi:MAG TPA: hypothetical protein VEG64_05750 [Candidatus Sulfotelmatobacter sp.]|nr:hypothetical protein [Candidatus Sulfotelmatobacter sp.]
MRKKKFGAIAIKSFALLVVLGMACLGTSNHARAQDAKTPYANMAPIEQYLMDRTAEIALARSSAPESISRDATVLVLGRQGFETAVEGKNGFVCIVERGWTAAFDWPEFWNPKVRAAACLNPQAARFVLPIDFLRTRMVIAGRSKAETLSAVKAAFENRQLPGLENGAMCYMMSKSAYLTDQDGHNATHVMFYTAGIDAKDWGSGAEGSPVMSVPYWFFLSNEPSQTKGLPPVLVSLVMVPTWSDGTPAGTHYD